MRKSTLAAGASIVALATTLVTVPAHAHGRAHEPEVVVDGLVGALTLAVADRGDVLVTQSFTGTLSSVDTRGRVRDIRQLPNPEAGELIGVAYEKSSSYHIETDFSGAAPTSHVVKTSKNGRRTVVSGDLWAYETARNPDARNRYGLQGLSASCAAEVSALEEALGGTPLNSYTGIIESHAYQLEVHRGTIYVADAAANAILRIDERTGRISTAAVLPGVETTFTAELEASFESSLPEGLEIPDCVVGSRYVAEPVPTDVQLDKHGKLYVSTLGGGAGELVPLSKVYRVDPRSGRSSVLAEGLHGATGLAVTNRGDVVVAEMFAGEVSLIRQHRRHVHVDTLFTTDAPPADVEVRGRTVYATTADVFGDATGALLKYRLRR